MVIEPRESITAAVIIAIALILSFFRHNKIKAATSGHKNRSKKGSLQSKSEPSWLIYFITKNYFVNCCFLTWLE
jgi:cell division protein FtsN